MAALYSGLADHGAAGFVYLSTGPWNLYDLLTEFLQLNDFPSGPLLLTDWGPNERYVMRSGREHKRASLRRLLDAYPDHRFVLVGDSGQGDAEVYAEIARSDPGRVRAIVVIDAGPHLADRAEELTAMAEELRDEGVPFHFVVDAAEAATVLDSLDLLADGTADAVALDLAR
jgi:phosphatidate phosphatase APP1